jgi:hypothetical protein
MPNLDYNPCVHFKSSSLYDWCIFIEFHPLINILIQVAILIQKCFCQIDDFIIHLWPLLKFTIYLTRKINLKKPHIGQPQKRSSSHFRHIVLCTSNMTNGLFD